MKILKDKNIFWIVILFLLSSVAFYGYYWLFSPFKFQLLYQSWDGPAYVVVAKSFYNPTLIALSNTVNLPAGYFANYFPLYPLFIKALSFIGYWRAAIVVTQVFTLLFIVSMYLLYREVYSKKTSPLIALVFLFFPARWFSITHIGSSEPLFLFLVVIFLILFIKKRYLSASFFLALAQITRHAAIWYFVGIGAYFLFETIINNERVILFIKKITPFLLVPAALLLVNYFFYLRYGDLSFWMANSQKLSYFQWPPLKIFSIQAGSVWREGIIFNYAMYFGAVCLLFKEKKYNLAFLSLFTFLPLLFFVQEDLSRIALTSLPLLYLGYHKLIENHTFQFVIICLIPAIYLFSFHFLNFNISP